MSGIKHELGCKSLRLGVPHKYVRCLRYLFKFLKIYSLHHVDNCYEKLLSDLED